MNATAKKKRFLSIPERHQVTTWALEHREFCKVSNLAEIHKRALQDTGIEMSPDQVRTSLQAMAIEYVHTTRAVAAQATLPIDQVDGKVIARGLLAILCLLDAGANFAGVQAELRRFAGVPELDPEPADTGTPV